MSKLRAAVIGVGHLGQHHARIYHQLERSELIGIVDHDPDRASQIAEPLGTKVFEQASDLEGKVDLVSIATPTEVHAKVALPLLEQGIHCLIEKPLAENIEEAHQLIEAAKRGNAKLMVGHSERFHPAVRALQHAVDAPKFIEVHRLAGFNVRSTDIDVVMDLMIHDLDLLLHLDGGRVESVDAVGVAALTDRVDIANARVRMSSGCVANLTASRISADPIRRLRVFQSRTYLACDTLTKTCERYRLVPGEEARPKIQHELLPVSEEEPLVMEISAFLESVIHDQVPPVDGQAGLRAMKLAFQVQAAIDESLKRVSQISPTL